MSEFGFLCYEITCYFDNFILLFLPLRRCLADEAAVLLLYSLLQGNSDFLEYVLVRTDLDTLVCNGNLYSSWKREEFDISLITKKFKKFLCLLMFQAPNI